MGREIKFRAWDKKHRQMHYGDIHLALADPEEDVIVERITGLKDTNGKEIYEGDKLYFRTYKATGIVSYEDSYAKGWWVRLLDREDDERQEGSLFDFITSIGWADSYEVVGTIHD